MKNRNIAVGFYQEMGTVQGVISKLKAKGFCRFATLTCKKNAPIKIDRYLPKSLFFIPLLGLLATFFLFFTEKNFSSLDVLMRLTVIWGTVFGSFLWNISRIFPKKTLNLFKKTVIADEILLLVEVDQKDVRETLFLLRQVKTDSPVTFLLRKPIPTVNKPIEINLEPMTVDQLGQETSLLGKTLDQTIKNRGSSHSLMKRFEKSHSMIQFLQKDLSDSEHIEQSISTSAEWLLDNMYVLEGIIKDVKVNLPKKYYKELPKLLTGPLAKLPRIYALAIELVKNTAGSLNLENISHFLGSYQIQHPLTIGELWAFPLMVRFRLIEWIEFLTIHVDNRMRENELASFWGNRLLHAARYEPHKIEDFLKELSSLSVSLSGHFAEKLLDQLFDEENLLILVKKWFEELFKKPIDTLLHEQHLNETAEQVVFANSIKSLITLSQLSWAEIFESISPVDAVLKKDPLNAYLKMDFNTRNYYRREIENLAKRVPLSEVAIAKKALSLAKGGVEEFERHIGYYLVDKGILQLEKEIQYQPTFLQKIQRGVFNHSTATYFSSIVAATCLLEMITFHFLLKTESNLLEISLFFILSLLPVSELGIQIVNFLLIRLIPTKLRPKMLFESGIPEEYKTLVVIPMMLLTPKSIEEEIERLEIRYLGNTDPLLKFGLFSDFADAQEKHMQNDANLLEIACKAIQSLENKYGKDKFFLFHRERIFSKSENAWIGWERKRGKLEYLNRFLMGEILPEKIVYQGNEEALKGIKYVITLDSDTELPKDQGRAFIEVLAHPLNKPYLKENKKGLERGYTIIQPRVNTNFAHTKDSWFCKLFSEPTIIDPYTQVIANVYQDLTEEGSYHGKGIYDLHSFYTILSDHFPEEHLLSHDLLEGSFVRVGFAGNVYLFDMYPKDYFSATKRIHRWMRGDFQIIDWLFNEVPTHFGKEKNPLSGISRWKIFDNLRRAILPVNLLLFLVLSWLFFPASHASTLLTFLVLILPCLSLCAHKIFSFSFYPFKPLLEELGTLALRAFITIALLPFEAYLALNALSCVIFRRFISHQHLLQWTACEYTCNNKEAHKKFILELGWSSLFSLFTLFSVSFFNPEQALQALPFCFLWVISPFIVSIIDKPINYSLNLYIAQEDKKFLRKIARKTWRYFDDLATAKTHFLPPDNYQTALNVEIAQRTSPTNIGLFLTSILSAYDFKYITLDTSIDKIYATLEELKKLERYEGHFLNWYNIQNLEPLLPRYVSSVDSGNLLACFWTLHQGLEEIIQAPLFPQKAFSGLVDTYEIFQETNKSFSLGNFSSLIYQIPQSLFDYITLIKNCIKELENPSLDNIDSYWFKKLKEQLTEWDSLIYRYFSWVEILQSLSKEQCLSLHTEAFEWKEAILRWQPSLKDLSEKNTPSSLKKLLEACQRQGLPHEIQIFKKRFEESLSTSYWFAGEKISEVEKIIETLDTFSEEMNLSFLYKKERKLFAIGYNVDTKRLDTSYYDLLASEARIASLVGIAKEDVPLNHWWALGRSYSKIKGKKVLLSWSGTMFEYLMPLIFNRHYSDSLLGEACQAAVFTQIAYGKERGIPWGISESAFSALDSHKIYQYKSFGVPGLALKRGLESDLVVSPYSSGLALMVNPQEAILNLKNMAAKTDIHMMGPFGYYESIDFTRQRNEKGERGVLIYAYMAHHQGMILAAINNVLNNNPLVNRFHKDPRIAGVSSLLYERIPTSPPIRVVGLRKAPSLKKVETLAENSVTRIINSPDSVAPKINILSNATYSLMITNSGGGYSKFQDIDIYRWRSDTTQDAWGSFCYLQDMTSKEVWSNTFHPTQTAGSEYLVHFKEDKSEFKRRDFQIETMTEIVISPEDNAEIRLITLVNHSSKKRTLQLTSYLELCLAPHLTDRAHPSFNKLFIETEALPEVAALIGFRRLRSPEDTPLFAVHVLSMSQKRETPVQYETDRSKFIGRGYTLKKPLAMEKDLSNTVGTVLDPIFSLREQITLEPGKRVQISLVTAISPSREGALSLIDKYKDITASHRGIELAWTYAQLELRHLRIHQEEVQLFQKLASRLLYPHIQLRSLEHRLQKNMLAQSNLWALGISGDLPILTITAEDSYDTDFVKQMLIAHSFLSLRGLKIDLVILNEEEAGYMQPLQDHLQNLINAYAFRGQVNCPGGIFLKNTSHLSEEELNLLFSVSRAVLIASRGSLRQQLIPPKVKTLYPPKLIANNKIKDYPSETLPFLELLQFNSLGGYSKDGKSYVIYLDKNKTTPAPWINVLANEKFGTLISESGLGTSWYGNSQSNRITPWSNDPLLNPISDTLYIRDEELGTFWTVTPSPIRELDPYRITHGQGFSSFEHNSHGINQELLIFVPVDEKGGLPLRIQRLKLKNTSSKKRFLSLTSYSELVLGGDKEETEMHILTEWDASQESLFAYNRYNSTFGKCVAFTTSLQKISSFSADRTEFIGRNRNATSPEALKRKALSRTVGGALDPCFSLQVTLDLNPQEEKEVVFILGYAEENSIAKKLLIEIKKEGSIEKLFQDTLSFWDKTLRTIQVEVPEEALNFSLNSFFLYQNLCCRFWGRTAFYQSSGAYGFRDQLQDSMALLYSAPKIARDHILKAASRQFLEGDVQHWWHPQTGAGIRTRCSDDLLWLPFVTAQYVRVTKDRSILEEVVPFLESEILKENEEEVFQTPSVSKISASLFEHCKRALEKGTTEGPHKLPLIGTCDWNDGMNRVGVHGKGESVWLAWFLAHVMHDFAELVEVFSSDKKEIEALHLKAKEIASIIEENAWDGEWYRRAYFDDGTPLGSKNNTEAMIDSLAQSWAVITGLGNPERIPSALKAAEKYLVKKENNLVLLLTPPFDKTPLDPGYIKGYPPGVRENGGQYTHGASWLALAYARQGEGDKAASLLKMISPTSHTKNEKDLELYKVEPYVVAADIYDLKNQVGRGGWTWYTGAAAWIYRIWLEEILGFTLRGNALSFHPSLPKEWDSFKIQYQYASSSYAITVHNPEHISCGKCTLLLDDKAVQEDYISLVDDGKKHVISVTLKKN